jgi:hypothetical protein
MNTNAIGRARIAGVVNGSGRIFATRAWIEKKDPAAINSAKHIRHRCRASRAPPRSGPDRITRTSPAAANAMTVPMKKSMKNGTPFSRPLGLANALNPLSIEPRASATATASAPTFTQRVHAETRRTVVSAVTTK